MKKLTRWLVAGGVLCFGLRACAPIEWEHRGPDFAPAELILAAGWVLRTLSWLPWLGLLLLLIAAGVLIKNRKTGPGISVLLLGIFGFILCWAVFIMRNLAPWTVYDTIQTPDGAIYSFVDSSFLQGQNMALARKSADLLVYRKEKVIGTNNGDSPRSWACVIRPLEKAQSDYGCLLYSDSGWLLGMRYDDHCYFAYHIPTDRFLGHGDIEGLSPFLLMKADTAPNPVDVSALMARMKKDGPGGPGCPTELVLRDGLTHPNPRVRTLAQQLLGVAEAHDDK
jgi:hypothetical protein